jgi:phage-related protein
MKPIAWLGNSREAMRGFPEIARQRAGRQLARVQDGLEPEDWKPMPSVGIGVNEIRIRAERQYRVIYVAKFPESVYVLHAFQKKAQRTPMPDIDLARSRYRALVNQRKAKW